MPEEKITKSEIQKRIEEIQKEFEAKTKEYNQKTEEYNKYANEARAELLRIQGAYLELAKVINQK